MAFINVSPPDQHGYCSLGTSVDVARPAVDTSRIVVAQINQQMPRTMGDGQIHFSKIDAAFVVDEPLPEVNYSSKLQAADYKIGSNIAEMTDDRSTLQLGIGGNS